MLFTLHCLIVVKRDGSQVHHKFHMQLKDVTVAATMRRNIAGLVLYYLCSSGRLHIHKNNLRDDWDYLEMTWDSINLSQ